MRRILVLTAVLLTPFALWAGLPLPTAAEPTPEELQRRIDRGRQQLDSQRAREADIGGDVVVLSRRIELVTNELAGLRARETRAQAALDHQVTELSAIRADLRAERARLARLRARLADSRQALATRLVELYKTGPPDLITLALDAQDFSQLLERTELLRRISAQDTAIVDRVRSARDMTEAAVARLTDLEARAAKVAAAAADRRDEIAAIADAVAGRRLRLAAARRERRRALTRVRAERIRLERRVAALERESRRVQARLARAAGAPAPAPTGGSGALTLPVGGPVTSTFGARWGRLHAGLDIAPPEGTPIRAAAGGTVAIAGPTGGYGNYTCLDHGSGLSTCYAHQSSIGVRVGERVATGQVIGAVGNTGFSTGPHLHFETRVNGAPVNPMGYL